MDFKKDLSLFDVTNIIVGSVIGADIYIASAITAGLLGPFLPGDLGYRRDICHGNRPGLCLLQLLCPESRGSVCLRVRSV